LAKKKKEKEKEKKKLAISMRRGVETQGYLIEFTSPTGLRPIATLDFFVL